MSRTVKSVKPPKLDFDPARLRRRRVAARLSVTAAAQAAGCSKSHVSKLEHGEDNASPEQLGRFADAYGCTVEDLMPDEAPARRPAKRTGSAPAGEEKLPEPAGRVA